jgi:hypothetical protein
MSEQDTELWERDDATEINASAEAIWALFEDVSGWTKWNPGIEKIEINGPFEAGAQLTMTLPGGQPLVTRLLEVRENVGFVDETRVGAVRVFVEHRIEALDAGRCRVVFSTQAFGPDCHETGAAASINFPEVFKNLSAMAEGSRCTPVGAGGI